MYERFTDRARKVMQLTNAEAQGRGSDQIRPEHILLAMLCEGSGVGVHVLKNLGVDLSRLKSEVERLSSATKVPAVVSPAQGPSSPAVEAPTREPPLKRFFTGLWRVLPRPPGLPANVRAKKVIEYAFAEARLLKHGDIGTEHLLLGLLDEHDSPPAQVLNALGVRWEALREETERLLRVPATPSP